MKAERIGLRGTQLDIIGSPGLQTVLQSDLINNLPSETRQKVVDVSQAVADKIGTFLKEGGIMTATGEIISISFAQMPLSQGCAADLSENHLLQLRAVHARKDLGLDLSKKGVTDGKVVYFVDANLDLRIDHRREIGWDSNFFLNIDDGTQIEIRNFVDSLGKAVGIELREHPEVAGVIPAPTLTKQLLVDIINNSERQVLPERVEQPVTRNRFFPDLRISQSVLEVVSEQTIDSIDLPIRVRNPLKRQGIKTLGDLVTRFRSEVEEMRGISKEVVALLDLYMRGRIQELESGDPAELAELKRHKKEMDALELLREEDPDSEDILNELAKDVDREHQRRLEEVRSQLRKEVIA